MRLVLAFAAVYLIWGSTYLGIAIAIETLPAFGSAAVRFAMAGAVVLAWCILSGRTLRTALHPSRLARAALVGTLMLGGGNGLVVWAISRGAPTGLTAVIIATTPFWLVALDRVVDRQRRVAPSTIVGLLVGFVGIVILAAPGRDAPVAGLSVIALCAVLLATLSWACGSIVSREGSRSATVDPLVVTAIQMIAGGVALGVWSIATERTGDFSLADVSLRSWLALAYLTVFGSIVAYTAFIWLLRHTSAAAVGTYAYVNPVVAIVLGVGINGEALTSRAVVASGLILGAVATITLLGQRRRAADRRAAAVAAPAVTVSDVMAPAVTDRAPLDPTCRG